MAAASLFTAVAIARADQTVQVGPDMAFSPASVSIAPGETITWNFNSPLPHTATSDVSTGPEVWDSGVQSSGTFSHTFNTPGTYPYYCAVHSFPGGTLMNGVVEVLGGATPTVTPSVAPATPTVTPTPIGTPSGGVPTLTPSTPAAGIPVLDGLGRVLAALALAAAGVIALLLAGRR
jgi:plastocyanin